MFLLGNSLSEILKNGKQFTPMAETSILIHIKLSCVLLVVMQYNDR